MSLAIYIHIPYCIQKCRYCDFTTFTPNQLPPSEIYVQWLKKEIDNRHESFEDRNVRSIYLGGGTPSILPPKLIVSVINHLKKIFDFHPNKEITIEINPGTINQKSLDTYQEGGINRFSLGVQTFRDDILQLFNREHSSEQTKKSLELLAKNKVSFSTDLLFALNHQNLEDLKNDLNTLLHYKPQHISSYYLDLPANHILQKNRPAEDVQIKMFQLINERLINQGFKKYEISSFAIPKFESRHNLAYWLDRNYWGIGLSAHSFFKKAKQRVRFWNPKSLKLYRDQIEVKSPKSPFACLPAEQKEFLKLHEALTDFCHTGLRTIWGLHEAKLKKIFGENVANLALQRLYQLEKRKWIRKKGKRWKLKLYSHIFSNEIFKEMTFLDEDIKKRELRA